MTTEISDAASELVQRLFNYFIDYRYGSSGTPVLWHVEASEKAAQIALTAARNSALEHAAIMADATGYEKVARGIRAMKVQV